MHAIVAFYQVHPFVFAIATFGLAYAYVRMKAEPSSDQWQAWNSEGRTTNGSTDKPRSPEPGLSIADIHVSEGARCVAQQRKFVDEQQGKRPQRANRRRGARRAGGIVTGARRNPRSFASSVSGALS